MKTLTLTDMGVLEAGYVKGDVCGFMVGSMMGAAFLWGPLSAPLIASQGIDRSSLRAGGASKAPVRRWNYVLRGLNYGLIWSQALGSK
jgi:hypothetical protein